MLKTLAQTIVTLFLCGDIMTGRGIDQVLPRPGKPQLHEPFIRDARRYVALAEEAHGPIARPFGFAAVWGDALAVLAREAPQARIGNLETSVTTSDDYWRGKGINYRMNPANIPVLTAAGLDAVALANNHVLDWGYAGLGETLRTLQEARIARAGAGAKLAAAEAPAVVPLAGGGRLLLFAFGTPSSGVPASWAATPSRAGVNYLPELSESSIGRIAALVARARRPGDVVVCSLHWGPNWGYRIEPAERQFAHRLIDAAGIDIVCGHSSHHAKGIEVYHGKPVFYGCGDFINDYEGIGGYEEFRGDLSLMYFVRFDPANNRLAGVTMVPLQMRQFRLHRATAADARWLAATLSREGERLGTRVEPAGDGTLALRWQTAPGP